MRFRFGKAFGWAGGFINSGAVPPLLSAVIQWLTGTSDGVTLDDKLDVITSDVDIRDVNCLYLDGTYDNEIDTGFLDLSSASSGVVARWCGFIDSNGGSYDSFMSNRIAGTLGTQAGISFLTGSAVNNINVIVDDGLGNYHQFTGVSITPDTYMELELTVDLTTGYVELLKDGVSVGSSTVAGLISADFTSAHTFKIGASGGSSTECKCTVVKSSIIADTTGVGFDYTFGEGSGSTVGDVSKNGNDGTILNGTWTTSDGIPSHNMLYGYGIGAPNSLINPNIFDSVYWTVTQVGGSHTVVDNTTIAPDGTQTACTDNYSTAYFGRIVRASNTQDVKVFTVYFKRGTITTEYAYLRALNAPNNPKVVFNIESGSVVSEDVGCTGAIEDSGSGWWKCTLTLPAITSSVSLYIGGGLYDGASVSGSIHYWNASYQLNNDSINPALEEKTVAVATFDGETSEIAVTSTFFTGDFTFSMDVKPLENSNGTQMGLLIDLNGNGMRVGGNHYQWRDYPTNGETLSHSTIFEAGVWYTLTAVRVGNILTLGVNGVEEQFNTLGATIIGSIGIGSSNPNRTRRMQVKNVLASDENKEFSYDLTDFIGKSATIIPDLIGLNDGTVTGATLDDFWGTRIADEGGVLVDSNYNLLQVDGGYCHNGCEVSIGLADDSWDFLDNITLAVNGDVYILPLHSIKNGKAKYTDGVNGEVYALIDGTWETQGNWSGETNPTTGQYPSKTGWTSVYNTISISYDTPFIDDNGDLTRLFYADLLALVNLEDDFVMKWTKKGYGEVCCLIEGIIYKQGTIDELTLGEYNSIIAFIDDVTCGVGPLQLLYDINDDLVTDVNDQLVLTQP